MPASTKRSMPFLSENSPSSCPVPRDRITSFLRAEAVLNRHLRNADLAFVRTASFDDCRYWLWRFPMQNDDAYALVLADWEGEWLSWRSGSKGASPEQVLLDDWKSGH